MIFAKRSSKFSWKPSSGPPTSKKSSSIKAIEEPQAPKPKYRESKDIDKYLDESYLIDSKGFKRALLIGK